MRQRGWSKRRNCQQKCFCSFDYIKYHGSIFFKLLLYCLMHLLNLDCFAGLTSLLPYKFSIWTYEFFKIHPQKKVFCYVSLSNFENVLQRNSRKDRVRESIFTVSGDTNFEKFYTCCQPWWRFCGFDVCTGLPKETLYKLLPLLTFLLLVNFCIYIYHKLKYIREKCPGRLRHCEWIRRLPIQTPIDAHPSLISQTWLPVTFGPNLDKMHWLTSGEWCCPLDNDPKWLWVSQKAVIRKHGKEE